MITYYALMCLACEHMRIGVKQLQGKKWARQPMDIVCTGVRQHLMEDLFVGVRQLQLGVKHLPMEDLCVGVRQLQLKDMNRS